MSFSVSITFPSDTRYLAPIRGLLAAVSHLMGRRRFPRKTIVPCTLALIEAVDNAIFHAHGGSKGLPIYVSLALPRGKIVMDVIDKGKGIGRHRILRPDSLISHGRGLYLIHRLVTKVESRMVAKGHRLRMMLKL